MDREYLPTTSFTREPLGLENPSLRLDPVPSSLGRRSFMASSFGLVGSVLSRSILFSMLTPRTASAVVEPTTAVALIQTAASIARLLQKSGPSQIDLLNLQTEMLKNLQVELGVIQDGIKAILARMEDLESLIHQIPDQSAVVSYKNKILARQGDYLEAMETYQNVASSRGIEAAREQVVGPLRTKVLLPLQGSRSDLMTYSQFSVIPMVCTAAFVEMAVSIMVGEASSNKEGMLSAISRYEKWFKEVTAGPQSFTLNQTIKDAAARQAKLRQDAALDQQYNCSERLSAQGWRCNSVTFHCYTEKVEATLHRSRDPVIAEAVRDMLANGYIGRTDLPVTIELQFTTIGPRRVSSFCENDGRPNGPQECSADAMQVSRPARKAELIAKANDLSRDLMANGLSLVSLKSLHVASDAALTFLAKMRSEITKH